MPCKLGRNCVFLVSRLQQIALIHRRLAVQLRRLSFNEKQMLFRFGFLAPSVCARRIIFAEHGMTQAMCRSM